MSILPREVKAPKQGYPSQLLCNGAPGVGKSSSINGLNKNGHTSLHVDLQNGLDHVGGLILNIKQISKDYKMPMYKAFISAMDAIRVENKNAGKKVYDFITYDPLTNFKQMITELAADIYNSGVTGKAAAIKKAEEKYGNGVKITSTQLVEFYSKDPVADLGQNGWNFYNSAWKILYESTLGLAEYCSIFIAHTKPNTYKRTEISEISVKEIDFWPAFTYQLVGESSDSCSIHRSGNKVIANFVFKDEHPHFKSRYFDGQEIVLSEKQEDGSIVTYWERIFPFLSTPKV